MKTNVYSLDAKIVKQLDLPFPLFAEAARDDLIKRAVLSDESKEYQPKGSYRMAGLETSARYVGRKEIFASVKNKGIPHLPHEVLPKGGLGKVKRVPHAVKGRRAHPPKPQKILIERMNKKEYAKAIRSALSMSAVNAFVSKRHSMKIDMPLPLVFENSFEKMSKTKDFVKTFDLLKLSSMLKRSKEKGSKSALVVLDSNIAKHAANNLPGFDVVNVKNLRVKDLAPGCFAGRMVIFTESSLKKLNETMVV